VHDNVLSIDMTLATLAGPVAWEGTDCRRHGDINQYDGGGHPGKTAVPAVHFRRWAPRLHTAVSRLREIMAADNACISATETGVKEARPMTYTYCGPMPKC
jgi:hypothetical protein